MNIRLLGEFRNFSVNSRWHPVVKHRQDVQKSSFHKLTMEMPAEVTPRTALSNFIRVRCEFFGQFQRLVRIKIRPSSIIIRYTGNILKIRKSEVRKLAAILPQNALKINSLANSKVRQNL